MKYLRNEKALKKLGERIKHLRVSQNTSQSQLAFEAGIPLNQVGRIERGEINVGVSTLFAIAKALDLEIKEFFNFEM